ncbi:MAG: fatty acid desaturase, partial [Cyanobium sp. MAG_237]|nr:fatty acid desaturase [Cyanobium sp. MAG_237]
HSIHHLCERIPNYRLRACHEANAALLADCPRLSLKDFPRSFRYVLWNSEAKKLLPLAEANMSLGNS